MRALLFENELRFDKNYPDPTVEEDGAVLKMRRAGICNTDLELIKGYMGFNGVLGHEFVAEVIGGPQNLIGKRVVGEINVADHTCDLCQRGIPSQCRHRTTVGIHRHQGAFADYLALTSQNLHLVPDSVSDDEAVFVEPLAAAFQVIEAVHISPRHRVVVIGAGKLGMLVAQVLRLTGADLSVVVRHDKQALLLQKWGIKAARLDQLEPERAQIVVDCTGQADGFAAALGLVEPRGTIVLKSTYHGLPQIDLTRVAVNEIRVVGSRCGPFDTALRALKAGLVDVKSLIEARYSFDHALEALEYAAGKGVFKVLLDF